MGGRGGFANVPVETGTSKKLLKCPLEIKHADDATLIERAELATV
jgi:hypothetical protein